MRPVTPKIRVTSDAAGRYHVNFIMRSTDDIGLVGRNGRHLNDGACHLFERETGIKLKPGTDKVFRVILVPQRKRRVPNGKKA